MLRNNAVEDQAAIIVSAQLEGRFKKNYLAVVKEKSNLIKAIFMSAYDELASLADSLAGPAIKGKDPASLTRLRELFSAQLTREIANNITLDEEGLSIKLMGSDELGFGDEEAPADRPRTVDVLSYYIEGVAGAFAFVTLDQYNKRGRRSRRQLGRFGEGIMIPKDRYKRERWAEVTGLSFEDVRHPISGFRPYKGFAEAHAKVRELLSTECVQEAVRRTSASLDGETFSI